MSSKRSYMSMKRKCEAKRYAQKYGNECAAIEYNVSEECINELRMEEECDYDPYDHEKVVICKTEAESRDTNIDAIDTNDLKPIIDYVIQPNQSNDVNESLRNALLKCDKLMDLLNGFRNILKQHKCFKKLLKKKTSEIKRFEILDNEFQNFMQNDRESVHGNDENKNNNTVDDSVLSPKKVNVRKKRLKNKIKPIIENVYFDHHSDLMNEETTVKESSKSKDEVNKNENLKEITIDYSKYYFNKNGKKVYMCVYPECKYKGINKQYYKDHILGVHNGILQYKCSHCGKAFKQNNLLKSHLEVHSDKTFECSWPGCESRFTSKRILNEHYNNMHLRSKYRECQWPGCGYKTYKSLWSHMQRHKTDNFRCSWPGCGLNFKLKNTLSFHYKSHTGENKQYVCDWPGCEFQTEYIKYMNDHKRSHIGVKEFTCSYPNCDKTFITKSTLKNHLVIHSGERNFPCEWPGCEYRALRKAHLIRHNKLIHERSK